MQKIDKEENKEKTTINTYSDARLIYEDIIDMPRPISKHKKMAQIDRAAQFAPFAALTGLDNIMQNTAKEVLEKHTPPLPTLSLFIKKHKESESSFFDLRATFKTVK